MRFHSVLLFVLTMLSRCAITKAQRQDAAESMARKGLEAYILHFWVRRDCWVNGIWGIRWSPIQRNRASTSFGATSAGTWTTTRTLISRDTKTGGITASLCRRRAMRPT